MNEPKPSGHPSALALSAFHADALDPGTRAWVEAHLAECERCRARRAFLESAHLRFTTAVFPRTQERLADRLAPLRARWRWAFAPGFGSAAALALLFLLRGHGVRPPAIHGDGDGPAFAIKGNVALEVYARHGERVFMVSPGERLVPGDAIRMALSPAGLPYALVVSVDGDGNRSVYFPYGGARSGRLQGGVRVELPGSITLDASHGPERLFALFSERPLEASDVTPLLESLAKGGPQALRASRSLPFPGGAPRQATFLFEKSVAP